MTNFPQPVADMLAKLLPRLASDQDGEVVATANAIRRTLGSAGLDLHDLAKRVAATSEPFKFTLPDNPFWHTTPAPAEPQTPFEGRAPRWDSVERSGRLAWLDIMLSAENLLTPKEAEMAKDMRDQVYYRPDKFRTPYQVGVLNRMLAKGWARGLRP